MPRGEEVTVRQEYDVVVLMAVATVVVMTKGDRFRATVWLVLLSRRRDHRRHHAGGTGHRRAYQGWRSARRF